MGSEEFVVSTIMNESTIRQTIQVTKITYNENEYTILRQKTQIFN